MVRTFLRIGVGLATLICTLSLDNSVDAQTSRRAGRIRAREMRQEGRTGAATYGNAGASYNNYNYGNYGPGGYSGYGGYGAGYRGFGNYNAPYGGPGYPGGGFGGSSFTGGPAYGAGMPRSRAYLGITMSEAPEGIVGVSSVRPGSPAAEAGLRPGDVLLAIDGRELYTAGDVSQIVARHQPGDAVEFDIDRNGRNDRLEAVLGDQAGQVAGYGPVPPGGGAYADGYGQPNYGQPNMAPMPVPPRQARRASNGAISPYPYGGYPWY